MPTLKPIKVTLQPRTHQSGQDSNWPDFRKLYDATPAMFNNMLPSHFFDKEGTGWHYNKVANLGKGNAFGEAVCLIPQTNADQILASGLEGVSGMTETELEDWWDNKSKVYELDEEIEPSVLQAIKAKRDLNLPVSPDDIAALDPDDETPGIVKNKDKTWKRYKAARNITVI